MAGDGGFALQTFLEETPATPKVMHGLARLYHDLGDSRAGSRNLQSNQRDRSGGRGGGAVG